MSTRPPPTGMARPSKVAFSLLARHKNVRVATLRVVIGEETNEVQQQQQPTTNKIKPVLAKFDDLVL